MVVRVWRAICAEEGLVRVTFEVMGQLGEAGGYESWWSRVACELCELVGCYRGVKRRREILPVVYRNGVKCRTVRTILRSYNRRLVRSIQLEQFN